MSGSYLMSGKPLAYFIRMTDDTDREFHRLYYIFKRTKSKRSKTKLAKRIDTLI